MSESWDEYAEGWDSNEDVIAYSEKAYDSLLSAVSTEEVKVFDFGCGTGLLTEKIAQKAELVVALDSSRKMISVLEAKSVKNITAIASDLTEQLLIENGLHSKFDLVVASSVLSFVENYEETLSLLKKLLKPGGRIVQWDWCKSHKDSGFGFTQDEVSSALVSAGFQDPDTSTPFSMESEKGSMQVIMAVAVNA